MSSDSNANFNSSSKSISRSASGIVILVGLTVIIGWVFDISLLKSIYPTLVSMKVNTAIAFILSGLSLWFLIDEQAKRWKIYLAQVCAVIVALLGGLSLTQYLLGIDFGIDQLLFTEPVGAIETSHAGRMAPATAFNFLFVGISLLLYSRKVFTTARVLISVVAIVGLLSFLGYVFDLSSLLHLGPFTIMAIHTSITFILITISLLSMRFIFNSEFIIRSGFWIAVVILSYIGIISYWNIIRQIEDAKSLTHSHEVIQKLEGIFSNVKDVETGVRGFVITGNEEYLEPYYAQYNSIETEIKELRILTFDNLNHQRAIVLLEPIVKDKIAYMSETITIRRTEGLSATVTEQYQTPKGKQLMDEIRVLIGDMKDEENKLLQEREKKSETSSRNAMVTLVVGNIVSFILLAAIFILLIRENRVRKQAELVSKQAEEEVRKLNADLARRIDKRTAELRMAYEKIQKNEERLRQTLDGMLEGIQIIGKDWRYRYLNDAAAKHGRKPKEEFVGRKMMEVYPGIEDTEMFAVLRRCMDERIPQKMENEFTYPDNTKRWFDLSIQPTPEGIFVLSIDITESKKAEEQRAELAGRMTRIASHVPGVIYQYCLRPDGSSCFPYASEGIRDIYGVAPDEVKEDATPVFNVLHPDDIERISKSIKKSAETLTKWYDVYRVNLPSGKTIWVEGNSSPQKQEDDSILWYGYIKDITERKHAEEVQRKSEEQFRLIAENVADMIAVLDLEGKRIYNNPAYKPILGDPELLQGTDSFQEIHPDDREKIKRIFKETVQTGIGKRAEYRFIAKDGSIHFIESQGSIIRGENGNVSNVVVVSQDITEKKSLEQQLLRSQRMESIGTLAGGIAHDLNNVLAPITLAIEILRKKHTDPDSERMLDTMGTSAKRGSDIVKQVLAFGRGVEGEKVLLQPKHVINEIVKISQETFPKNVQLRSDVPKNLWVINADPTQIHQVLLNTFVNARDAMPSGGTITISAENIRLDENYARMHIEAKPGNYVLISVADTGTGIPPEIIDRIFEPFFTTKEIGKGTGLGLSTVRSIIKSHGGFINVYSEKNKGTTFKFYLPAETKEHAVEEAEKKPELPLGNGELILVVDDEASIREITKATLEASGYRVATACDGTEALAVYAEKGSNIAVVITDMMMPFMDGVATIRALKRMNPSVKIIASSGRTMNGETFKEGDLAVHTFISKPYTAEVLLKVLNEIITKEK